MLGFIEACSQIRFVLVQNGAWEQCPFKDIKLRWARGVIKCVEHTIEPSLIVHPSPDFDAVATFLGWLKRLPIAIRATSDSVADYKGNEARLSSINFDDNVYIPALEEIWFQWLRNFRITEPFLPRHGSGATADKGKIKARKWSGLSVDAVARVCFRYPDLSSACHWPVRSPERVAKVTFVPKQAGKDRTICMEPAWLQFLQQGIRLQLTAFTHRGSHPLSKLVDVYSQDVNRRLCANAVTHRYATIDLSDASDSVSWRLIKRLARRIPLLRYLYGSRSNFALLVGEKIRLDKFAPMGSALCFIVECILFASVVELAHRIHYGQASKGHLSGCSVYGDDIICPAEIYHLVVDILTSLGFKVNQQKSFSSGAYFESCGVEYLHGALITTIKHPRGFLLFKDKASPEQVGTITDLANSFHNAGYFLARRLFLTNYQDTYVRIGTRQIRLRDLLVFDDKGLIPIIRPFTPEQWNAKFQRSGRYQWVVDVARAWTIYDFVEWKSQNVPRSRSDRLSPARLDLRVDEKWSNRAVLCLSKFHHWDLLRTGDVETNGSCRTGRMHYKFRKQFRGL